MAFFIFGSTAFFHYFCSMKLYGMIGRRLGHSFSADFFNSAFKDKCIDARYCLFEIPEIGCLHSLVAENPNLAGLNVTIPYKESVIPFLDSLTDDARSIGAVNLIEFAGCGDSLKLIGHNTDAPAFRNMAEPLVAGLRRRKALILGTGGAAKAARFALDCLGIESVLISRSSRKGTLSYNQLDNDQVSDAGMIVNATPAGMWPDTSYSPPFPYQWLSPAHVCIDLIYNPATTTFMAECAQKGATVKNGLEMLIGQARIGAGIWGL